MYWDDLNKDNIELAKELYENYIERNKQHRFVSGLESFEQYLQNHVIKCLRCEEWFDEDTMKHDEEYQYYCEECYDDLYYPISKEDYESDIVHDEQKIEELNAD